MALGGLWSLFVQAAAVERAGPIRALQRSAALVSGNWFRVAGVWLLMGIVVSLLQAIPGVITGIIAAAAFGGSSTPAATPQGFSALYNVYNLAQTAGSYVGGIIFGALPMCAATITFVALRNQREGTDLTERLESLSAAAPRTPTIAETPPTPTLS